MNRTQPNHRPRIAAAALLALGLALAEVEKFAEHMAPQLSPLRSNLPPAQRDLVAAQTRLALARVSPMQAWEHVRAASGQTLVTVGPDE